VGRDSGFLAEQTREVGIDGDRQLAEFRTNEVD
jgi:hypothetical protein